MSTQSCLSVTAERAAKGERAKLPPLAAGEVTSKRASWPLKVAPTDELNVSLSYYALVGAPCARTAERRLTHTVADNLVN